MATTFLKSKRLLGALFVTSALILAGCSSGGGRNAAPDRAHPAPAPPERGGGSVRTDEDPQSTFAVDVDSASYGYTRRLIGEGRLPDPANVRPEEFVNAFRQEYPEPSGNGFAVHADGSRLPVSHAGEEADGDAGRERLLRVGLQTKAEDAERRRDAALTFVVDVSGSMDEPGRLDLVQDALHTLIDQLRPTDSVALVAFSSEARVVREMTRVSQRRELHAAVDDLRTEQSTNLEAGLVLGYRVARDGFRSDATNRVIILSDGLANVGNTESTPIVRQIREEAEKQIALLGVGVGSDYGDELMEQLADKGDGFVVYVSEREQARKIFVEQLPATLSVRALDAKVQVTFEPKSVESYRLIGYDNRAIADKDFTNDRVDGGEVGPGHSVTALYAIRLTARVAPGDTLAQVQMRWLDPRTREADEAGRTVRLSDVEYDFAESGQRLRVCYAAGYFAEVLRQAPGGRGVRLAELSRIAADAARATRDADVDELSQLISKAAKLD